MNVSPNFSVSLKIMKPYFLIASFTLPFSFLWLFFIDASKSLDDLDIVGWTHLYMLGFVMLSIFSAMAQLGPVVVETKHNNEKIFKYVWKFLVGGLFFMLIGFYIDINYLLIGGLSVLISMSIYALEFLKTLKNMRRKTAITHAMKMSNFFLLFGILSGLAMALNFNAIVNIDIKNFLNMHTFILLFGFILLLIMAISIILIPMFGYAKRISDNTFFKSFITLSIGVFFMLLSPLFKTAYMQQMAYILSFIAVTIYIVQLYEMFNSRKKIVHDIWARSNYIAFISFILSFFSFLGYFIFNYELLLRLSSWLLLIGFFSFLIMANFYKIIPFLIWFQKYSPLIEKQQVPMLHELLPKKLSNLQFIYSSFGLITSSFGILINNYHIFYAGVLLLGVGGLIFFISIFKMLKAI